MTVHLVRLQANYAMVPLSRRLARRPFIVHHSVSLSRCPGIIPASRLVLVRLAHGIFVAAVCVTQPPLYFAPLIRSQPWRYINLLTYLFHTCYTLDLPAYLNSIWLFAALHIAENRKLLYIHSKHLGDLCGR